MPPCRDVWLSNLHEGSVPPYHYALSEGGRNVLIEDCKFEQTVTHTCRFFRYDGLTIVSSTFKNPKRPGETSDGALLIQQGANAYVYDCTVSDGFGTGPLSGPSAIAGQRTTGLAIVECLLVGAKLDLWSGINGASVRGNGLNQTSVIVVKPAAMQAGEMRTLENVTIEGNTCEAYSAIRVDSFAAQQIPPMTLGALAIKCHAFDIEGVTLANLQSAKWATVEVMP
jgi:hypothetical protein